MSNNLGIAIYAEKKETNIWKGLILVYGTNKVIKCINLVIAKWEQFPSVSFSSH